MYIVDYERGKVVNMDRVVSITPEKANITAHTERGDIILGVYENEDRALGVFSEMLTGCFPPNIFIANNCEIDKEEWEKAMQAKAPLIVSTKGDNTRIERFDIGVYYMPEK